MSVGVSVSVGVIASIVVSLTTAVHSETGVCCSRSVGEGSERARAGKWVAVVTRLALGTLVAGRSGAGTSDDGLMKMTA